MGLGKEKILAVAVASAVAVAATATMSCGIAGKASYGTAHVIDAMSATKKFKDFERKNGQKLEKDRDFRAVRKFVNDPCKTKLVATLSKNGVIQDIKCFEKRKDGMWVDFESKAVEERFAEKMANWKREGCKFNFEVVQLFLEDIVIKASEEIEKAQKMKQLYEGMIEKQRESEGSTLMGANGGQQRPVGLAAGVVTPPPPPPPLPRRYQPPVIKIGGASKEEREKAEQEREEAEKKRKEEEEHHNELVNAILNKGKILNKTPSTPPPKRNEEESELTKKFRARGQNMVSV